jgi:hypothetical protein
MTVPYIWIFACFTFILACGILCLVVSFFLSLFVYMFDIFRCAFVWFLQCNNPLHSNDRWQRQGMFHACWPLNVSGLSREELSQTLLLSSVCVYPLLSRSLDLACVLHFRRLLWLTHEASCLIAWAVLAHLYLYMPICSPFWALKVLIFVASSKLYLYIEKILKKKMISWSSIAS